MDSVETTDNSQATEVAAERSTESTSIRDALSQNFDAKDDEIVRSAPEHNNPEPDATEAKPILNPAQTQQTAQAFVPPADMNAAEKDAFLNPTADNRHILQNYMNRRAYETRSDYAKKSRELEILKEDNQQIYNVVQQYENEYAKQGISVADLTRRSIAWDKAMQNDPYNTALEWLEAYGINPHDLLNNQQGYADPNYNQATGQYLTRQEAEQIAEEKWQTLQQQQQQNAVAYYNERVVESFLQSKPLFKDPETGSQLEQEMAPVVAALTQTGRYSSPEQILETAYNYVVNGNPTFSTVANAMAAKPVIEQKIAVAQKAKAASRSISGSPGSGTPRVETKDLRDNLRRRFSGD